MNSSVFSPIRDRDDKGIETRAGEHSTQRRAGLQKCRSCRQHVIHQKQVAAGRYDAHPALAVDALASQLAVRFAQHRLYGARIVNETPTHGNAGLERDTLRDLIGVVDPPLHSASERHRNGNDRRTIDC